MSCGIDDASCETPRRRGALFVLGLMTLIFAVLSYLSFVPSRGQVTPDTVTYGSHEADAGKRVFQAYNCMGCHTMVGNGAYFGPDLTHTYAQAGPAWLAAFLPSAATWPTEAAVRTQLLDATQRADTGIDAIEAYLEAYPGAAARIERRGGHATIMPNLPLTRDEIGQLIAYMKYTSAMNTEGWPPKILVKSNTAGIIRSAAASESGAISAAVPPSTAPLDPVARGAELATEYGCIACHANDQKRLVGPGWGGLYNSTVTLADGSKLTADDAYLAEAIRAPDTHIVEGYPSGVMPAYDTLLSNDEVDAIVAYLRTLEKQ